MLYDEEIHYSAALSTSIFLIQPTKFLCYGFLVYISAVFLEIRFWNVQLLRVSSRTVVTTEGDQRQTNIMLLKQFHAPNFVVLTMNTKNLDSQ